MDDALRKLRAEKHQQYLKLHPTEKPKIEICPQCQQETYKQKTCSMTGLYHHWDRLKTIGSVIVEGNTMDTDTTRRAVQSKIVKWEKSYTNKVRADASSLNIFQTFVQQRRGELQRFGYLYGLYDAGKKEIEVHAIYEPEQIGSPYCFHETPDPFLVKADAVAAGLGLRRVGVICTHPARDPDVMQLSSREALLMTREQCKHGRECVLLTIAPNIKSGEVECLAWQASEQCMNYYRLNKLAENTRLKEEVDAESKNDNHYNNFLSSSASDLHLGATTGSSSYGGGGSRHSDPKQTAVDVDNEEEETTDFHQMRTNSLSIDDSFLQDPQKAKYIYCSVKLEVAEEKTDVFNGKSKYVSEEASHLIDSRWFTSYIAMEHFNSVIIHNLFARLNRPGLEPPTFQNLKIYFDDPKRKKETFVEKISDFHVLLFLAQHLSLMDDMPPLLEAVRLKKMTQEASNYEFLLQQYWE